MSVLKFTSTPPVVRVIGVSTPDPQAFADLLQYRDEEWGRDDDFESPSVIPVYAGSTCYKSHANKAGRTNREYLRKSIIENGHHSVLEHVTLNFGVASLPRSTQLELVRHRAGTAYSFTSQRFTDNLMEFIIPPLLRLPENEDAKQIFMAHCISTFNTYHSIRKSLEGSGSVVETGTLKRKRIKENTRGILNNANGSDGVVSLNVRALRHIVALRTDPHAEAGIREFAFELFNHGYEAVPDLLQDAVLKAQQFGPPQVVFEGLD